MVTWIDPVKIGMKETLLRNAYNAYSRGTLKANYARPVSDSWSALEVRRVIR